MASFAAPQFQQPASQNQGKEASTNGVGTQSVGDKPTSTSIQRIEEEPLIESSPGLKRSNSRYDIW